MSHWKAKLKTSAICLNDFRFERRGDQEASTNIILTHRAEQETEQEKETEAQTETPRTETETETIDNRQQTGPEDALAVGMGTPKGRALPPRPPRLTAISPWETCCPSSGV